MSLRRFSTQTMVVSLVMLVTGCRDREITAYRAPKEAAPALPGAPAARANTNDLPPGHPPIGGQGQPAQAGQPAAAEPAANPMAAMAAQSVPTSSGANALSWTAPAGWQAKAPGSIRKGSYTIPGDGGAAGDLSITAFPGDTGGLVANVNRWRGQVGLPSIADAEVQASLQHVDANGLHMEIVVLTGAGNSLLGAIVPHLGQTWFFKLLGPEAIVSREKPAFLEFVRTIKPTQP